MVLITSEGLQHYIRDLQRAFASDRVMGLSIQAKTKIKDLTYKANANCLTMKVKKAKAKYRLLGEMRVRILEAKDMSSRTPTLAIALLVLLLQEHSLD